MSDFRESTVHFASVISRKNKFPNFQFSNFSLYFIFRSIRFKKVHNYAEESAETIKTNRSEIRLLEGPGEIRKVVSLRRDTGSQVFLLATLIVSCFSSFLQLTSCISWTTLPIELKYSALFLWVLRTTKKTKKLNNYKIFEKKNSSRLNYWDPVSFHRDNCISWTPWPIELNISAFLI